MLFNEMAYFISKCLGQPLHRKAEEDQKKKKKKKKCLGQAKISESFSSLTPDVITV
jgi:hypothetical protein